MLLLNGEVYIDKAQLWLDPKVKRPFSFVSHGHSDHLRRHRQVLVSERTAHFYRQKFKGGQVVAKPFNQPFSISGCRIELFPSGHILGASQILVEDSQRIVYTGDFKLRKGETAEEIQIKECDILIMESTYGLPQYVFPPQELITQQMVRFIEEALDEGTLPILLAYRIGKAQEVMKILGEQGFQVMVDEATYETAKIYERLGMKLPDYGLYNGEDLRDKVLIIPSSARWQGLIDGIERKRTAVLTGWAVDGSPESFGVDAAFPFSDHADFVELLSYVRAASPKKVYTGHGFPQFCSYLRKEGFDAEPLPSQPEDQLWLW